MNGQQTTIVLLTLVHDPGSPGYGWDRVGIFTYTWRFGGKLPTLCSRWKFTVPVLVGPNNSRYPTRSHFWTRDPSLLNRLWKPFILLNVQTRPFLFILWIASNSELCISHHHLSPCTTHQSTMTVSIIQYYQVDWHIDIPPPCLMQWWSESIALYQCTAVVRNLLGRKLCPIRCCVNKNAVLICLYALSRPQIVSNCFF